MDGGLGSKRFSDTLTWQADTSYVTVNESIGENCNSNRSQRRQKLHGLNAIMTLSWPSPDTLKKEQLANHTYPSPCGHHSSKFDRRHHEQPSLRVTVLPIDSREPSDPNSSLAERNAAKVA